ncbi:MAG: hypothetical protein ACT4OH_07270 [Methylophilaceae bacterium]
MNFLTSRLFYSALALLFPTSTLAGLEEINRIFRQQPTLSKFEICQGGGCALAKQTSLNEEDWQQITPLFTPSPRNAEEERGQVSRAIGLLEELVGDEVGTASDRAGTFDNSDYTGQQDCNDEAINSTTYLRLLQQNGFLQFHEIEDMRTRNFFFTGWPHTTAVIREVKSGIRYAVDSWFYDNGHPATIVPFQQWKANYQPEDSPVGKSRTVKARQTKPGAGD